MGLTQGETASVVVTKDEDTDIDQRVCEVDGVVIGVSFFGNMTKVGDFFVCLRRTVLL